MSQENYSTLHTEEWAHIARLREELTQQRDKLSSAYRRYEAGEVDGLEPGCVLADLKKTLARAVPDMASSEPLTDVSIEELLSSYWSTVQKRKNTATTGFKSLNEALGGGLEPGRLVCGLGVPNCGKTTFFNQVSDFIADSGRPVLYVTCEDTPSVLLAKTLSRIGNVKYNAVLKGYESDKARINDALLTQAARSSSRTLRYLDAINGNVSLEDIRERAGAHFAKFESAGAGVLVIDYLQRLARAIKSRLRLSQDLREVVTMVAETLRGQAVELDCTVIAITAQNRNNYARGESGGLASAKESGDIEYSADVMLSLCEDKDAKRVTPIGMLPLTLHIDKNRQGEKGRAIALNFNSDRQQFTEVER